jgi:hypothetical protein
VCQNGTKQIQWCSLGDAKYMYDTQCIRLICMELTHLIHTCYTHKSRPHTHYYVNTQRTKKSEASSLSITYRCQQHVDAVSVQVQLLSTALTLSPLLHLVRLPTGHTPSGRLHQVSKGVSTTGR